MVYNPQVFTQVNVEGNLSTNTEERYAAFMGTAQWGPVNKVILVTGLQDFIANFGDEKATSGLTLIKAMKEFFQNGGVVAKVVRVEDGSAAASTKDFNKGITAVLTFTGKYKGTLGDSVAIRIDDNGSNRNVYVLYGNSMEVYNNVGAGYTTNDAIAATINAKSNFVTATVKTGQGTTNLVDAIAATYLTSGADGTTVDITDFTTAFNAALLTENYNYLLIPGQTDDTFNASVLGLLVSRATTEKLYSEYLSGIDVDETIADMGDRTTTGYRFTVLGTNVKATNRYTGTLDILDGSYMAADVAGVYCNLGINESGTRKTVIVEGLSVNSTTEKEYWNKSEIEEILTLHIVPVSLISGGTKIARSITRNTDGTSPYIEQQIVDLVDFVTSDLESFFDSKLGLPNTQDNADAYRANVDAKLDSWKAAGYISSYTPSIVTLATSLDSINVQVSFIPVYALNFVYLNITVMG